MAPTQLSHSYNWCIVLIQQQVRDINPEHLINSIWINKNYLPTCKPKKLTDRSAKDVVKVHAVHRGPIYYISKQYILFNYCLNLCIKELQTKNPIRITKDESFQLKLCYLTTSVDYSVKKFFAMPINDLAILREL